MLEFDWESSVGCWICLTSHALRRALCTRLAQEKITLRQWEVLAWLSMRGRLSQAQLSECMGLEPHTLTGVVNRMVRDGWIQRCACPQDRRKSFLQPTAEAEDVWRRTSPLCREVRAEALAGFDDSEIQMLKSLCERVRNNLAEAQAGGLNSEECDDVPASEPEDADASPEPTPALSEAIVAALCSEAAPTHAAADRTSEPAAEVDAPCGVLTAASNDEGARRLSPIPLT